MEQKNRPHLLLGAAYLLGQDDKKGSIAAGKLADFTILDRNPLQVSSPMR
jgi:predicted amidohydrolase YtcJ